LNAAKTPEQRITVLSNRAAAYSQQKLYDRVIKDCTECLELDPQIQNPSTLKVCSQPEQTILTPP
jgi:hypothetical protein